MEHQTGELLSNLAVTIPSLRSEVGTLSGGQRQQVAVARSLLGEPKVVLLDEPTAALGVAQTEQVLDLIRRLRERDLGVVVISHNLVDVFEVADRIFVLRLGRAAGDFAAEADHRGARRLRRSPASATTARSRRRRAERARRRGGGDERRGRRRPPRREAERAPAEGDACGASSRATSPRCGSCIGLALIWIIFQFENDRFLSAENLTNLMLQITAIGLISVGIVFVLLLGEIDLSVGAVSGLAAAVMAVLNVKHGWNPYLAIAAAIAVGHGDRRCSRAPSSAASASPPSSSPWPACWPGRERCCRCSARPARSTSPTPRSPASPTPSTPTRSAGSSPRS